MAIASTRAQQWGPMALTRRDPPALTKMDPLRISFVDALQALIDAIPGMQRAPPERLRWLYEQLLDDIAACAMTRWRRKRAYPRVVKVKMSNFRLKRSTHKQLFRDFDAETKILGEVRRAS